DGDVVARPGRGALLRGRHPAGSARDVGRVRRRRRRALRPLRRGSSARGRSPRHAIEAPGHRPGPVDGGRGPARPRARPALGAARLHPARADRAHPGRRRDRRLWRLLPGRARQRRDRRGAGRPPRGPRPPRGGRRTRRPGGGDRGRLAPWHGARASGESGGHYDKQRLVLFAEAGPLAAPPPEAANESPRDFTAGTAPGVLQSFVPLGVSICHEILYPDLIGRAVAAGASLLVNISNDGWLDGGYGAASRQHFAMAVFRAVETRRYLVRAATTGVSGIVDPFGRVVETVAPGAVGAVTGVVAARGELTPYVRFGDAFALLCILHIAALIATTLTSARTPRAPEAVPTFPQDTAVDTKRHAA